MMRATNFEVRHQMLLHLLVVGVALFTYVISPDDVVWALVRDHSNSRGLERLVFGVGGLIVLASAALETWGTARGRTVAAYTFVSTVQSPIARLLFVLGLGLLLPAPGTVVLIAGETILMLRLLLRARGTAAARQPSENRQITPDLAARLASVHAGTERSWQTGFRVSASKWGVAASLIFLSATLQDRIAEVVAGVGFLAWLIMNALNPRRSSLRSNLL